MVNDLNAGYMQTLNVVRMSIPFGQRKNDEYRRHQFRPCLEQMYAKHPRMLPLWGKHGGDILRTLDALGVEFSATSSSEDQAWDYLGKHCALRPSGRRVHMSRFCAAPYSLVKTNERWSIDEFELEHCCLEFDFLGSKN